jgi:hypothetical protein
MWADKSFVRRTNTPLVLDPDVDGDVPDEPEIYETFFGGKERWNGSNR